MGISNQTGGGNRVFVKLAKGKFIGRDVEGNALSGTLVGIGYEDDEYEGRKIRKLRLDLLDEGKLYKLGVNANTVAGRGLAACLPEVDPAKPMMIQSWTMPSNDKISLVSVLQDGNRIVRAKLPEPDDSGGEKNYSAANAAAAKLVEDFKKKHDMPDEGAAPESEDATAGAGDYDPFSDE